MSRSAKKVARLAVLTALGTAFLFLGSAIPTARLGVCALAGIFAAAGLMMYGYGWAFAVYAATAALALVLVPDKLCALLYAAFFGFYPLVKALAESRLHRVGVCWAAKLGVYTAVFLLWWLVAAGALMPEGLFSRWYVLWPLGGAAFAVYDICFSFFVSFYQQRISGYFQ